MWCTASGSGQVCKNNSSDRVVSYEFVVPTYRGVTVHVLIPNLHGADVTVWCIQSGEEHVWVSHRQSALQSSRCAHGDATLPTTTTEKELKKEDTIYAPTQHKNGEFRRHVRARTPAWFSNQWKFKVPSKLWQQWRATGFIGCVWYVGDVRQLYSIWVEIHPTQ